VAIEYRWAARHHDRLPAMAADLVHRVVIIATPRGTPGVLPGPNPPKTAENKVMATK
jgi:hypothetical protein